jgi:hypothetical protein
MTTWTQQELESIGAAEEIQLMPRRNGTQGKAVTIWVVQVGDDLYVRSVNGRTSYWFCTAQLHHEGRIRAGRLEKAVTFVDVDLQHNDEIDAAYRAKYRRYRTSIVDSIVSPKARSATIRLLPG